MFWRCMNPRWIDFHLKQVKHHLFIQRLLLWSLIQNVPKKKLTNKDTLAFYFTAERDTYIVERKSQFYLESSGCVLSSK